MRFRKRPVIIEATQWYKNGDHPDDGQETFINRSDGRSYRCEGKVVRRFRSPVKPGHTVCNQCQHIMADHGWIDTLEGGHVVCPGDWIITGVQEERYPCKPEIFEATYERVEE